MDTHHTHHQEAPVMHEHTTPTIQTLKKRLLDLWAAATSFERLFASICIALAGISLLFMIRALNESLTMEVPTYGGELVEGMIGSPRFVNPVLAVSETDRTLSSLVYSGLMKTNERGELVTDLAKSYTVSPDGKVYTFVIRDDATFHDGAKVTARDITFTIDKIRDPIIKSPHRSDWEGVSVNEQDEHTIVFRLEKPYAPFLQNTTLGILPMHEWKDLTSEEFAFSNKNIAPIGSGPYAFVSVTNNTQGIPYLYALKSYANYAPHAPYISTITTHFYHTSADALQALESGEVTSLGGLSTEEVTSKSVTSLNKVNGTLPRVFALFFNQNRNKHLNDSHVRAALEYAIDKHALIESALGGKALPLSSPLIHVRENARAFSIEQAQKLLDDAGWELASGESYRTNKDKDELTLSIATANTPELKRVAQTVAEAWKSVGVRVKVELFEMGDLNQTVLRPRAFDVLLFGEITGREPDLFAFWHSSQKSDPGLNIAQYQNKKADSLLEKARGTYDPDVRHSAYDDFETQLHADVPAIFLYAPQYTYIIPENVHGASLPSILEPYERFNNIASWYTETERVWHVFADKNEQTQ